MPHEAEDGLYDWYPTEAQFAAYKKREVELFHMNNRTHSIVGPYSQHLFSFSTFLEATRGGK